MKKVQSIRKVAIVGVGLMGGSLALALKKKLPRVSTVGYARSQRSYDKLKKLKIVDSLKRDLQEAVCDADLVVLALPIGPLTQHIKKIAPFLKKGAIVMDVGSSKALIEKQAKKYLPKTVAFVGCHPLCGSEKAGAAFANGDLYQGAVCLVTTPASRKGSLLVRTLWKRLGSTVVSLSAAKHDELLASLSHLPHLLSFALTQYTPEASLKFAPPSWKDLTRISNAPFFIWTDIFTSNRKSVVKEAKKFIKVLQRAIALVERGDTRSIADFIAKVNRKQQKAQ